MNYGTDIHNVKRCTPRNRTLAIILQNAKQIMYHSYYDLFIFSRGVTTPSIRIKRFLWESFDFIEFFSRLSRAKVNFALHSLLENFEVSKFISNFAA
jgi:hypothetical protein